MCSVPEVSFEASRLSILVEESVPVVMLDALMPLVIRPPAMLSVLRSYRLSLWGAVVEVAVDVVV